MKKSPEHEKMREELSLVAISSQMLLECEAQCTSFEAQLEAEREKNAAAEKAFATFYMTHKGEEKEEDPVMLSKFDALMGAFARLEAEVKIERAARIEDKAAHIDLIRRCDMMMKMMEESADVGEIKINFDRGQDGKIKSPLRIN